MGKAVALGLEQQLPRLTALTACFVFCVESAGNRGGAALVGQGFDVQHPFHLVEPQGDHIPHPNGARWLDPIAINIHMPCGNGFLGKAAGFIKAYRPQPFI